MKTSTLLLLATGLTILATPFAAAQDLKTASEGVVACIEIEDGAEKLACFEAASNELALALDRASDVAVAEAASEPVPKTARVDSEVNPATEVFAVAQPSEEAASTAQQVASVESDAVQPPERSLPSWIPRISFGSGGDVEKEPDEYRTEITRIQRNALGRHFFTTSDGYVWRQIGIENVRAPDSLPAEAVIFQNITGGLRLRIVGTNRSYSVLRVE